MNSSELEMVEEAWKIFLLYQGTSPALTSITGGNGAAHRQERLTFWQQAADRSIKAHHVTAF